MTDCQSCTRPTDLYLCSDCTKVLGDMIQQLPWLLAELDARIQRLDRTSVGTIGRQRRPDELNVMDFGAAETARKTEKTIRGLVATINGPGPIRLQCTVAHDFIGPLRPAWRRLLRSYRPTITELIDWLTRHVNTIARHPQAGHVYRELRRLVGTDHRGGQLLRAINPVERHLVGPCPTITGRDHQGHPRHCGHVLFADTYDRTVTCPTCHQDIDVERNRTRAAAERDLHTEDQLLEVLTNCGEPVDPDTFKAWIKTRRIRPAGRLHNGLIVPTHTHDQDPYVYSVKRARKLRRRDQQLAAMRTKVRS